MRRLRYQVLSTTAGLRTTAPFSLIDRVIAAGFLPDTCDEKFHSRCLHRGIMALGERIIEGLPEDTQTLLQTYAKDVKGCFGDQLEGLLLYGSAVRGEFLPGRSNLNMLLVVSGYDSAILKRYERSIGDGARSRS